MDTGVIEGGLNVTLTIRLLMHGKVRGHGVRGRPQPPHPARGWPFREPGCCHGS